MKALSRVLSSTKQNSQQIRVQRSGLPALRLGRYRQGNGQTPHPVPRPTRCRRECAVLDRARMPRWIFNPVVHRTAATRAFLIIFSDCFGHLGPSCDAVGLGPRRYGPARSYCIIGVERGQLVTGARPRRRIRSALGVVRKCFGVVPLELQTFD